MVIVALFSSIHYFNDPLLRWTASKLLSEELHIEKEPLESFLSSDSTCCIGSPAGATQILLKPLTTFVTWMEAWRLKAVRFLPKISPVLMRPDGKTWAFKTSWPHRSLSPTFLLITHSYPEMGEREQSEPCGQPETLQNKIPKQEWVSISAPRIVWLESLQHLLFHAQYAIYYTLLNVLSIS